MKLILLSGGSGKRLWPLSNDSRSKQFLKVLRGADGRLESMVQRVWGQLEATGLAHRSYIATGKSQLDMIQSQVGFDVPIIVEPERRDTFPAIALAAVYLYSIEGVSLQETVAVLPVDPYVETGFFEQIKRLESVLEQTGADLALMGVEPDYPSEKYGYIVPVHTEGEGPTDVMTVSHFVEKPDESAAERLIAEKALWNCGVFAFKLDYVINLLVEAGLPIHYEEMARHYHKLPGISFDYQVVEKAERIAVTPYRGYWKDLGTWNTLSEEIATPVVGKGTVCSDSVNTHLINELDIPVAILGLSNIVVSVSPDGILVADKNASPKIKEFLKGMEQRPMYEERRWGFYRVLDYKTFPDGKEVLTKRICVEKGKNLSYQRHAKRSEVWTVISGMGELIVDGQFTTVAAGDVVKIPVHAKHSIRAVEALEIIEVQSGDELVEEDIERFCLQWDEILQHCRQR